MKKNDQHFDPAERAAQKEASRRADQEALASGQITKSELARRNSMFGAIDLRHAKIIGRPKGHRW